MSSKVNVTKSEPIQKPSFIPTPSPFATPSRADVPFANRENKSLASRADVPLASRENKTNIKVNTTIRINRTDILKNPEPISKQKKIIQPNRQATNYIEICIIMIIVYIIYRCCIKKPVKKNPRYDGLPIHTPPTSPDNKMNQEVYYAFHQNTPSAYRRTNSSHSLT
jgi:hypothetical protein